MIQRTSQISTPLTDDKVVVLEQQLQTLFTNGAQIRTGEYTGDGTASRVLTIGVRPLFVYIARKIDIGRTVSWPVLGNSVFSSFTNIGVSYIPGAGYVKDAVLSFSPTGITLGSNANVNASKVVFNYFIIA